MRHDYDFLIIGGGMVADAAEGIREQGATGSIGIVGEESTAPFPRPALSKKLWTDPEFSRDDAALETAKETGASLHLGSPVVGVDPAAKTVETVSGEIFGYDRLLIATGGHQYPDRILGRTRVEHVDNAPSMGAAVGRIMAGSPETYDHTPMYYSDLHGHGFGAVGTLDASFETVVDEVEDGGGTVVYYLDDDAVRGVLLWDCDGGVDAARELLARGERPADASALIGTVR